MDPAPRAFDELPRDPELGVPVPFACGTADSNGPPSASTLDGRRVTQCALSRVCGVCGSGLGRPIAFVGSEDEWGRAAFHFPPSHLPCVDSLLAAYSGVSEAVLGQPAPQTGWVVVTTAGFEFQRASAHEDDRRATFRPNSVIEERLVAHTVG